MDLNLSKLLKKAKNYPKIGLSDSIWRVIEAKQAKSRRVQSFLYSSSLILSFGGFVFMSVAVVKEFILSGFFQYVSIAFSGGGVFAVYWKEYLLTLADSLPVASLGVTLFLLVSMLVSIRKVMHQFKNKLLVN